MPDQEHYPHRPQTTSERAALSGDVASKALNEALRVSFRLLKLAMALVVILFLGSGIFTVKQHEQAFILRFGKVVEFTDPLTGTRQQTLGPGLHFAWPFLIDEVVRFPVRRDLNLPVATFAANPPPATSTAIPETLPPDRSGYNLTGDANILHSRWVVNYSITSPVKFCEKLGDPTELAGEETSSTLRKLLAHLTESAVIRTVARYPVDDAYRGRRDELRRDVKRALIAALESLDVGIQINEVILDAITPPVQTKKAFDEVTVAGEESRKLIEDARGYQKKTEAEAKGAAERIRNEAKAYATKVVAEAEADAGYMSELLKQYPGDRQKLSHFLRQRLNEVLTEVLKEADEVYLIKTTGEVRLWLSRDPDAVREIIKRRSEDDKKQEEEK